MSGTSTVLAVRKDLVRRFAGYLDAAGITETVITRGDPTSGDVVPYRFVAVATTADSVQRDIRRLPYDATTAIDETYDLRIIIWQMAPGDHTIDGQIAATDKAWEILGVLDDGLRSSRAEYRLAQNPDGSGELVSWCSFTSFNDDEMRLDLGRAAQIDARLTVHAKRV